MPTLLRTLILCLMLSATASTSASDLTKALGDLVEASSTHSKSSVEFCPDNTCAQFTLRGRHAQGPLHDFVFTYLFGISTDPALTEFQSKTVTPEIKAVLSRYRAHCPETSQRLAARCLATYLAKRYDIRAAFVRYDEGERFEVPRPLSDYVKNGA